MIIGAYFTDGTVLIAPLQQTAQLMGVSEGAIKMTMDGKHVMRGVILSKLPNDTPHRIPQKVPKIR